MHFPIRALVPESHRELVVPDAPSMPISDIWFGGDFEEGREWEVWNWHWALEESRRGVCRLFLFRLAKMEECRWMGIEGWKRHFWRNLGDRRAGEALGGIMEDKGPAIERERE